MKRVGCLYRVSTKNQGDKKNDIPVQRNACLKFIQQKDDWKFEKEYLEFGVSGYKLTEAKRDVLQEIKKDVLSKKIDILLVFMFDRIGRREEETPLVVRWLVENGTEVWSVNEGQRKIESREDKLINYITYWQAEGESEKISLRATDRRIQLTKDGIYLGNYAPFGYELIKSEELVSKIGKNRRILIINPAEAKIVKCIFNLYIDKNYGTNKIAIYLNNKNMKRRNPNIKWENNAVLEILRNPIYKGYVSFGKRTRKRELYRRNKRKDWILADKPNKDIIIIPEKRWEIANKILDSRNTKGERQIRLLSGLTRCGYCKDYITPKGKGKYVYMVCKGKANTGRCKYIANYRVDRLEEMIKYEIKQFLNTFKKVNLKEMIIKKSTNINNNREDLKRIDRKLKLIEERILSLKGKVVSVLVSKDQIAIPKLSKEIEENKQELEDLENQKKIIQEETEKINCEINSLNEYIPNWSQEFEDAPLDIKRKILTIIVEKIRLYNDKIEICVKYPISTLIVKRNDKSEI